jgi:hypothetical protein
MPEDGDGKIHLSHEG